MTAAKKTPAKKKTTTKPKLLLYGIIDTGINGTLDNANYMEGIHFYRATSKLNAVEQYLAADWDDYYGGGEADVEVFFVDGTTFFTAVQESWSIKEVKIA